MDVIRIGTKRVLAIRSATAPAAGTKWVITSSAVVSSTCAEKAAISIPTAMKMIATPISRYCQKGRA